MPALRTVVLVVMLPAGFGTCTRCGRLLVVDGLTRGRCTRDCGGTAGDISRPTATPAQAQLAAILDETLIRYRPALDEMSRWPEGTR